MSWHHSQGIPPTSFPGILPHLAELGGTKMCLPPRLNGKGVRFVLHGQGQVEAHMGLEGGW